MGRRRSFVLAIAVRAAVSKRKTGWKHRDKRKEPIADDVPDVEIRQDSGDPMDPRSDLFDEDAYEMAVINWYLGERP
jgi:hypothetical protein